MAESPNEDFLDVPEPPTPAYADETLIGSSPRRSLATWMSTGAWLLAGLVVGALIVAMLHTSSANSATTSGGQLPGGPPGAGFGGGFGRGLPGEQHIIGTLTGVGASSIRVNSASGTATYPIDSSTLLVKDGQRVSSLSALKAGDTVVVHVYPHNGITHTEMVLDGIPSGRDAPDDNPGTTTET
jgi:hypothetical protein